MKRGNDFIVGLVVIGSVVAIVLFSLWLSQASLGSKEKDVVARFTDVGNAKVGNSVVIRGVQAGRIQSIELETTGWVLVKMSLDQDIKLPSNPVVVLSESSMFGEWQATIMERSAAPDDADVQQQLAQSAAVGRGNAIPGARLPDIAQLTAVAGRIAGDMSRVADRFQVAFDDRAAAELRQSIRNFADLSAELERTVRSQSQSLSQLGADVHKTVGTINATAVAVQRTADRVDSSTSKGQIHQIMDNVGQASEDIKVTSHDLRDASHSLMATQQQLSSVLTHADSVLGKIDRGQGSLGMMVNDPTLYQNGDALLSQMRELVAEIRAHPRQYLSVKIF
ncbi:MAG TPA: MlaD family protein [Gemmatimonadaceae bacterium]|jgi:phospholipid/cholesterol/gamma-HCH transport system substrate-binding protein